MVKPSGGIALGEEEIKVKISMKQCGDCQLGGERGREREAGREGGGRMRKTAGENTPGAGENRGEGA